MIDEILIEVILKDGILAVVIYLLISRVEKRLERIEKILMDRL